MRVFFICSSRIPNRGVSDIIFTNCDTAHCISSITITHCNSITKIGIILFTNSDRCTTFCFGLITHCSSKISIYFRFTTDCYRITTSGFSLCPDCNSIYRVTCGITTNSYTITSRISCSIMTNTDVISTSSPAFTSHSNRVLTATSILVSWIRVRTITNCNRVFSRCHRYITNRYRSTSCCLVISTHSHCCTARSCITIT